MLAMAMDTVPGSGLLREAEARVARTKADMDSATEIHECLRLVWVRAGSPYGGPEYREARSAWGLVLQAQDEVARATARLIAVRWAEAAERAPRAEADARREACARILHLAARDEVRVLDLIGAVTAEAAALAEKVGRE